MVRVGRISIDRGGSSIVPLAGDKSFHCTGYYDLWGGEVS